MKKSILLAIAIVAMGVANAQEYPSNDVITFTALINAHQYHGNTIDNFEKYVKSDMEFIKYLINNNFKLSNEHSEELKDVWGYNTRNESSYIWMTIKRTGTYNTTEIHHRKEGYDYLESKAKQYCTYKGMSREQIKDGSYTYMNSYVHEKSDVTFRFYTHEELYIITVM